MFWCEKMKRWCSVWSCNREQCEFQINPLQMLRMERMADRVNLVSEQAKKLRPCKIEIPKLFTYHVTLGGYKILKNISEAKSYNGIFHKWVDGNSDENFPKTKVCGLIEHEDGTVHLIPMEYIIFINDKLE